MSPILTRTTRRFNPRTSRLPVDQTHTPPSSRDKFKHQSLSRAPYKVQTEMINDVLDCASFRQISDDKEFLSEDTQLHARAEVLDM